MNTKIDELIGKSISGGLSEAEQAEFRGAEDDPFWQRQDGAPGRTGATMKIDGHPHS